MNNKVSHCNYRSQMETLKHELNVTYYTLKSSEQRNAWFTTTSQMVRRLEHSYSCRTTPVEERVANKLIDDFKIKYNEFYKQSGDTNVETV